MDTIFTYDRVRLGFDEDKRLVRIFESKDTRVIIQVPENRIDNGSGDAGETHSRSGDSQKWQGSFPNPEAVFEALLELPDQSEILCVTVLPKDYDTMGGIRPKWAGASNSLAINGDLYLFDNIVDVDELRRTLAYHWGLLRVDGSRSVNSSFSIADLIESNEVKVEVFDSYSLKERFAILMAGTLLKQDWDDASSGYATLEEFFEKSPILTATLAWVIESALRTYPPGASLSSAGAAAAFELNEKIEFVKEHVLPSAIAKLSQIVSSSSTMFANPVTAEMANNGAKVLLLQLGTASDIRNLRNFTSIVLAGHELTPNMMAALSEAGHLEAIDLANTDVDATYLQPLSKLPNLRRVDLSGSNVLGSTIVPLIQSKSLKELDLARTRINDTAITYLAALKNLSLLNLQDTDITADCVESLRSQMPACEILST
jgi:hypothetical protein